MLKIFRKIILIDYNSAFRIVISFLRIYICQHQKWCWQIYHVGNGAHIGLLVCRPTPLGKIGKVTPLDNLMFSVLTPLLTLVFSHLCHWKNVTAIRVRGRFKSGLSPGRNDSQSQHENTQPLQHSLERFKDIRVSEDRNPIIIRILELSWYYSTKHKTN